MDLIKTKLKVADAEDAKEEIHSLKVYPKGPNKSLEEGKKFERELLRMFRIRVF